LSAPPSVNVGAFEKLLGDKASTEEIRRLCEVKEALGIGDNDALWMILVALERYDALYREYPKKIGAAIEEALDVVRQGAAVTTAAEAKRAERKLAEVVASAALKVAKHQARASWMDGFCIAGAAIAVVGGCGLVLGYSLGSGGRLAPWTRGDGGVARVLSALFGAPAGWTAGLLLLPLAAIWARTGWQMARTSGSRFEQAYGVAIMALTVGGVLAIVATLWRLI
jgi:hypothetical protein